MAVLSHGKGFSAHSAPRSSRVAPFSKSQPLKVTLGQISTRGADVITGLQIRTARSLLGWDRRCLARACKLRVETLARAESVDGEPPITIAHARVICAVLERAGVDLHTRGPTGETLRRVSAV
jgi:ribosome-binding protein aMBF1 (putative translation factor)